MKNINWNDVSDVSSRPVPGGYVARIVKVEDDEEKEQLRISWDFVEGEFKGANRRTYDSFHFWPTLMVCSYKDKALPFFKVFKEAVEASNPGYIFRNDPQSLVGKYLGVVLGEEEYRGKDGAVKKRLYVAEKIPGKAIREGAYEVPALKKLSGNDAAASENYGAGNFAPLNGDDEQLPF